MITTESTAVRLELGIQGTHIVVDQMSKTNAILTRVDFADHGESGHLTKNEMDC